MNEKPSVLIVEDAPENIDMLAALLSPTYHLYISLSGEEALKILKDTKPDLILLDVILPGIDGFHVCHTIRNDDQYGDMPIIFLTSESDAEKVIYGFEVGGQDYISKPFRAKELLSRVQTQIELQQKRRELLHINSSLEEKVRVRTSELEAANKKMKALNEDLEKANKELLSLDEAKSQFISLISHEIRTPLTGIIGFTDILKRSLAGTDKEEIVIALKDAVTRLHKFSEKALLITKIQTSQSSIQKKEIKLFFLVNQIVENFEPLAFDKKLKIEQNLSSDHIIIGNPDLISECLRNIVENAVKYTPDEGKIQIFSEQRNGAVVVNVENQGNGFSQETLDSDFSFYTPGEQHVDQNIGLGLATSKLIMDVHSGEIHINNSQDGACVSLQFPKT